MLPVGAIPVHCPAALRKSLSAAISVGPWEGIQMGKSALVHQSGEEVRAQGSEEHTQPQDTVQVKCNQCWSGFLGSLVCLSS